MEINVIFSGIEELTGLVGDETSTRVIVLAPTVIEITDITGSSISGESVTFHGTLLDEHGDPLIENGVESEVSYICQLMDLMLERFIQL